MDNDARSIRPAAFVTGANRPPSVDSGILDTSVEAFDRHLAVNTRGTWLLGRPQDTAELVALLLSPAGGWINGQLLHSNGGFHLGV